MRWFSAEGEIISVPRKMGMNKKCVRNNEVDLWILTEDGRGAISCRNRRTDNDTAREEKRREFFRITFLPWVIETKI